MPGLSVEPPKKMQINRGFTLSRTFVLDEPGNKGRLFEEGALCFFMTEIPNISTPNLGIRQTSEYICDA